MAVERRADPDRARLAHMTAAVEEALRFAHGKRRADLDRDRKLALAIIKDIEIAGEAASRLSAAFRRAHAAIPWGLIVATRNRLIHGYFEVDFDIVWQTVRQDLPALLKALRRIR